MVGVKLYGFIPVNRNEKQKQEEDHARAKAFWDSLPEEDKVARIEDTSTLMRQIGYDPDQPWEKPQYD